MFKDKIIDSAVAYRLGKDSGDKLASLIPEEDRALYDALMEEGLKAKEDPRDEVVLVLAATPWEHFGPNDNGDALFSKPFYRIASEGTLPYTYKTFKTRAMASRNHQYKSPDMAIGVILYAAYNSKYKRVEVMILYKWGIATNECLKIARKKCLLVSMGYRIYAADLPASSGEFCSYCGHHNRVPADRCEHLKTMIGSLIDGVPVYMMNGEGYFVDISSIVIPGDFNARTIMRAEKKTEGQEKTV